MENSSLWKYQEYCKPKESRHDIFKIQHLEDEILEDYLERFIYTLHKSKYSDLQEDAVRTLFLKGIFEDLLESLNLMAAGDISIRPLHRSVRCVKIILGVVGKLRKMFESLLVESVPSSGGVTRIELGNLLENFKTDILGEMGSQLDALQAKKR